MKKAKFFKCLIWVVAVSLTAQPVHAQTLPAGKIQTVTPAPAPAPAGGSESDEGDDSTDDQTRRDAAGTINSGGSVLSPPLGGTARLASAPPPSGSLQSTVGCPFYNNTETVASLISSTRTHLQSMIARANTTGQQCPGVASSLSATQTAFTNLTRNAELATLSSNPGAVGCTNYEGLLRQQYNMAMAEHANEIAVLSESSNQYVRACESSPDFEACVQQRYVAQLGAQATTCRNTQQQNLNADTRQNIESMVSSIEAMISNPETCGALSRENILQSGLQQATSVASMAAGIGLPSLGISIVGRLLSSLATSLFNRNNPQTFLRALDDDNQRPGMQCLFYDLQRTVLRCDSPAQAAAPNLAPVTPCETNISNISSIADLSQRLNRELADIPRTPAADRTEAATVNDPNAMYDRISAQLTPNLTLLQGVAASLNAGSVTDTIQGAKLSGLLSEFAAINSRTGPLTEERISNFVQKFANTGTDAVDLPRILQRYLNNQSNADQTFASALTNSTVRRIISSSTAESVAIERELSRNEQSARNLGEALTAMVRTSRDKFADRIEKLKRDWDNVGGNTAVSANRMGLLNELFTMCMTTQGMSYFNGPNNVNLFSEARPNNKYVQACRMFECPNAQGQPTLFVPFNPADTRYGSGPVADRFARYQCAQNRALSQKIIQLRENVRAGGICGR